MKINIYGIGAIGSHLTFNLALANKELEIRVIDFDKVEDRNIGVHVYFPEQVGMLKINALEYLLLLYGRKIEAVEQRFCEDSKVDGDLIVDAFDNAEARNLLFDKAKEKKIPCVHISFSQQKTYSILWDDNYIKMDKTYPADVCNMPDSLPFIKFVTGLAANVILHYINTKERLNFIGTSTTIVKI